MFTSRRWENRRPTRSIHWRNVQRQCNGNNSVSAKLLKKWSREWELNPRPADYESAALPLSYLGQTLINSGDLRLSLGSFVHISSKNSRTGLNNVEGRRVLLPLHRNHRQSFAALRYPTCDLLHNLRRRVGFYHDVPVLRNLRVCLP